MLVGPDRARAASRRGPPPGPSAVTRGDPVGVDEDVADELDLGSARPALNCHTFQLAVLDAAGLVDGTGNYHTRGGGCPVLAPGRRWAGRLTGRRRWPGNLPDRDGDWPTSTPHCGRRLPLSSPRPDHEDAVTTDYRRRRAAAC